MATILEFRIRDSRATAPKADLRQSCADIVIFPGIRYERSTEPLAKQSRRGRRRDRLELEE